MDVEPNTDELGGEIREEERGRPPPAVAET
jgi:hypothetical protein